MTVTKLKDVAIMTLDDARIERVVAKFAKGDSTQQEAFGLLVEANVKSLAPYSHINADTGKMKVVSAAPKALSELLRANKGLTALGSHYIQPSVAMAKDRIEDNNSKAYQYVIDNLTEPMDTAKGDYTSGATFSPTRLKHVSKALKAKKDSKFEVDAEQGLLLNGKRFGSYSPTELKREVSDSTSTKSALDRLADFFGICEEDAPSGKEKLGTVGNFLKNIRADYEGTDGNQFALDACDTLETAMFGLRDELAEEVRLNESVNATEKAMKKTARRLARQGITGAERTEATAPVVNAAGSEVTAS